MPEIQLKGRFISFTTQGEGARTRLIGLFSDGSGTIEVVWFQKIKQIRKAYSTGFEYVLFGKPTLFNNRWNIVHPEIDTPSSAIATQGIRGVFPLTETLRNRGITSRVILNWVQTILSNIKENSETLPQSEIERNHLMGLLDAIKNIHTPQSPDLLQKAKL